MAQTTNNRPVDSDKESAGSVKSVSRAIDVLMVLAEGPHHLGTIAEALSMPKGTTHRLLTALVEGDLVTQDPMAKTYALGAGCLQIADSVANGHGALVALAWPALNSLASSTAETVTLQIRMGLERIIIGQISSEQPFRYVTSAGTCLLLHTAAAGRCLLAYLQPAERRALVSEIPFVRFTENTITDRGEFMPRTRQGSNQGVFRHRRRALSRGNIHRRAGVRRRRGGRGARRGGPDDSPPRQPGRHSQTGRCRGGAPLRKTEQEHQVITSQPEMEVLRAPPMTAVGLAPDRFTENFWEAARRRRLVFPHCTSCRRARSPIFPDCPACSSPAAEWVESGGEGTVFSFTIVYHALLPEYRNHIPYCIAVIELADVPGVRLISNIVGCSPAAVTIGSAVSLVWDDTTAWSIPRFGLTL